MLCMIPTLRAATQGDALHSRAATACRGAQGLGLGLKGFRVRVGGYGELGLKMNPKPNA